jgi:hypothetical protein
VHDSIWQRRVTFPNSRAAHEGEPLSEEHRFICDEVDKRCRDGVFVEVPEGYCHVVNPISTARKANGKLRFILDARYVNAHLARVAFRQEDIRSVPEVFCPGDYFCNIDLEDAYLSVPVAEAGWPLFAFAWRGKHYVVTALSFGFGHSPLGFVKTVRPVLTFCRVLRLRLTAFMDDFMCAGASQL